MFCCFDTNRKHKFNLNIIKILISCNTKQRNIVHYFDWANYFTNISCTAILKNIFNSVMTNNFNIMTNVILCLNFDILDNAPICFFVMS